MRVLLQHRSRYVYPRPALLGPQLIRLRPADHARARIESYRLDVAPEHRLHWQRDPHGNRVARVTFKAGQPVTELDIVVELAVDVHPVNPFDFFVDDRAKTIPFQYPDDLAAELGVFLDVTDPAYRLGRLAVELLEKVPATGDTVGLLVEVNRLVKERVAYVIRDEAGVWTPEETLQNGRGSCRDSAVLLVALLRARGIAARFASGYLIQLTDEGMIPNEPKGVSRDVVDLHAWAEAYLPGAGWIGLDGTSGLLTGEGHIPLACTASPAHASPLDGTSNVGASAVEFSTAIARLGHETRPTAPFTDEVWSDLLAAGDRADAALGAAGLNVTVGGEPTFTARENVAAAEWQGGALGPDKWKRGRALADELLDRLAPGGLVLHRQGKQYPGESMPRWALDVIARRDGVAMWPQRELRDCIGADDARRFGEQLAAALGVSTELHGAFEDPWEVVRGEAQLPPDIDPRKAGLDDPEERRRLAKIFGQGVGSVVGWVLPLARSAQGSWLTERWSFRRGELFLLPGDSPVGLRLPLGSLAASPAPPLWEEPDVDDPRRNPDDADEKAQAAERRSTPKRIARPGEPGIGIRTALAIEPRDGELWLFLPPVGRFEDFCALINAIDRARAATGFTVNLEGYGPPPSPNLRRFGVTPDPGVLEVNLPPTYSAREAADVHATVFDAALASGLTAERYMLDGRMAGSGGGNHITIGGPTPLASPWLVRPDTLASLITFAQHHPSLSYMFTGLFVGPTSQAPRVDEARHDALYELEVALPHLFDLQNAPPTWQIDAVLRHLLVDVAGSTHRAEISIDKLFDPLTPHGRQGLVELRAFEMPPHPRMAAAQVVLTRGLLASFVKQPYKHALVRWGAELHDRFLLPYYMWRDFEDVLAHLAAHDVALPADAYRPFVDLRCPLVGALETGGARVEVRNAIEPWHVLGEEATQTGTARYVDSSMERLEIRSHGLDEERYVITINGVTLPMRRASGGRDVRVGGVRFRAWCPPHALHPHLGIHHPVRVDIIDTWAKRGVAGGTYHVWHPEGRAYDAPPLTRVEASARRAQRWTLEGPAPWPVRARTAEPHPEQPYTLDLRRLDAGKPMPRAEEWITE
ncbi:MAG TPA: transglutaminase family protein [Kofleriaceae bacterium]|nr:transglutaminase family protein [Kofleriaceae bacterium]